MLSAASAGPHLLGEAGGVPGHQLGGPLGDQLQLLARRQTGRRRAPAGRSAAGASGRRPGPCRTRRGCWRRWPGTWPAPAAACRVLGQGQHPGVEVEPGQLPVEEPVVRQGGHRRRLVRVGDRRSRPAGCRRAVAAADSAGGRGRLGLRLGLGLAGRARAPRPRLGRLRRPVACRRCRTHCARALAPACRDALSADGGRSGAPAATRRYARRGGAAGRCPGLAGCSPLHHRPFSGEREMNSGLPVGLQGVSDHGHSAHVARRVELEPDPLAEAQQPQARRRRRPRREGAARCRRRAAACRCGSARRRSRRCPACRHRYRRAARPRRAALGVVRITQQSRRCATPSTQAEHRGADRRRCPRPGAGSARRRSARARRARRAPRPSRRRSGFERGARPARPAAPCRCRRRRRRTLRPAPTGRGRQPRRPARPGAAPAGRRSARPRRAGSRRPRRPDRGRRVGQRRVQAGGRHGPATHLAPQAGAPRPRVGSPVTTSSPAHHRAGQGGGHGVQRHRQHQLLVADAGQRAAQPALRRARAASPARSRSSSRCHLAPGAGAVAAIRAAPAPAPRRRARAGMISGSSLWPGMTDRGGRTRVAGRGGTGGAAQARILAAVRGGAGQAR